MKVKISSTFELRQFIKRKWARCPELEQFVKRQLHISCLEILTFDELTVVAKYSGIHWEFVVEVEDDISDAE